MTDFRTRAVAVAVLAAAVFLASVTIAVDRSGGDGGERGLPLGTTTAPPTTGGPTTAPPTTGAVPSQLEAVITDITEFVERERGLEFLEPVDVELADDAEFERRLLAQFEESRDDLVSTGVTLRALGLLDPDVDIVDAYRELLAAGVVGFYDPETKELLVRGSDPTPYVREVIAHELTHALDDQHFDLDRPELDEADDERGFGFTVLGEGNAVRIEDAYVETLTDDERSQALAEQFDVVDDLDIGSLPPVLVQLIGAPYELGPVLVAAILERGGQQALDAAFGSPPTTSEQALEPEVYLRDEGAVPVAEPPADGELADHGSLGALVLGLALDQGVDRDTAAEAVEGWGGDAYVSWLDAAGRACIRLSVVGDRATDTAELAAALAEWAPEHSDAAVDTPEGAPVTLTACN